MSLFNPRIATVTIYQGDDLDEIRQLENEADAAFRAAQQLEQTLDTKPDGGGRSYLEIAEEHDKLAKAAKERAVDIKIKALPFKTWRKLVAEHPPREDVASDKDTGVNEDTFPDALVTTSGKTKDGTEFRTLVGPADLTDADLENLSDADIYRLYLTAFALNRGTASDPKDDLASQMIQKQDAILKQRNGSASASDDSEGSGRLLADTE